MLRILLPLALLLIAGTAASAPVHDARGDVHVSPKRLTVEYAAPEVDILSFDIVSDATRHGFIIVVAGAPGETLREGRPTFAVTFQTDDHEYAALTAQFQDGEWRFHLWTRNTSGENAILLEGSFASNTIHIAVPHDVLRSGLHWFVVSSMLKGDGASEMVDGGPAWFRDSLPDEGRGPPFPLDGADDPVRDARADDAQWIEDPRREVRGVPAAGFVLALALAAWRRAG